MAKATAKTGTVGGRSGAASAKRTSGERVRSSGSSVGQKTFRQSVTKVIEKNRKAIKELAKH